MNKTQNIILMALVSSLVTSKAATFASGYTIGTGSQLLTTNGGNGTSLFADTAATGGADLRDDGGNPNYGWVIDGTSFWSSGNSVSFTGVALPIWANSTNATNNTKNGTFTLTFYTTGSDNTWNGTNNLGTSDDSLLATVNVTFNSENTGVSAFYANFDSSINWTADSSSVFFTLESTGSLRLKVGPGTLTPRANEATGASLTNSGVSLAGTVVPEPSTALLGSLAGLLIFRRRR